ncbi:Transposon TX1 uncharacterized 149 kDa protein [Vitis vinifera]|uniref:Transposon TX1 uncharacterized 149 kDa protein n=1 Tax=Vitis vinifera TaxID=29760 RepID=A0A438GWW7_VITVI|nr:Transposon TX1 uncharacterized 149 kDa protein [Vitis vinifera]
MLLSNVQVSQEPFSGTSGKEGTSKTEEEDHMPLSPGLRRRFVPASKFEDRSHDTIKADASGPVKLDAAAQAHIEKHRYFFNIQDQLFENMWLKVDGFKDLLRGWWQESGVSGKASFRLASKLKVLKQKIKDWNRDVFGRLEVNKNLALQQVEFWDRVESEKSLSVRETKMKKQAKETFKNLNSSEAEGLELPFTEEEIHSALLDMNDDKALGLDGFTMAFWQFCWDFVKEEIVDLFKEFFEQKSFAKSFNITFLILIPKKGGAEDLGDFRPISLLGGLYKLLAKVLANRLKVLGKVVSKDQNAFVRGRQILDASLIANEVIDFWHKRLAQDEFWVSMDGVDLVVHFNCQIFYPGQWGASRLLLKFQGAALRRSFISLPLCPGLRGRGRMEMDVSHLLFADDTIIFCEARKEYLTSLSWILAWFEAASRLRINLTKSELIPIGEVEEVEEMAVELGCKVGALPSVYLGLPLGAHHKAISMWDGVEERMRRRLVLWKRQYISKGGRITLIKSTLASIPIY